MADISLLTVREVMQRTGMPRATLTRKRERGDFPPPLRLTSERRHICWASDQVDAWIKARDGGGISAILNPFMKNKSATDSTPVVRERIET